MVKGTAPQWETFVSGGKGNILGYRSTYSPAAPQGHDTKRHFGIHIL